MTDKNDFTVFYAWQSDSPAKTNRNFIENALNTAIKNIKKTGTIEASPRLDKDTKNVPGIPDIANTILEKIRSSDVFLADVSFVGTINKSKANDKTEKIPNPNVMIELGYALAELGWERIVLVLNTATGNPEELPFDLRNRRWPITYDLSRTAGKEICQTCKTTLTEQFQSAIEKIAKIPPRKKEGSLEQRIDTIEKNMISSVSQHAILANLIDTLQQKIEITSPAPDDPRAKCHELREILIQKVNEGKFENVSIQQGMLVLIICPVTPYNRLPLFENNKEDNLTRELKPLYSSGWNHRIYGDRFVTFTERDNVIEAVTEINQTGIISAVGHEVISIKFQYVGGYIPDDIDNILYIPSVSFEKSIIEAVLHYLKALVNLGVVGPLLCGLGITKIGKSIMYVGTHLGFSGSLFEGESILSPIVEIPADIDLTNPQSVAQVLRPAFDYIWREHNFPQSMNYGISGDWVGH